MDPPPSPHQRHVAREYLGMNPVRCYTFGDLMARLTSPDWGVSTIGNGRYIFVPVSYLRRSS